MKRNIQFPRIKGIGLQQNLMNLLLLAWLSAWKHVPGEDQVNILKNIAENHLGVFLANMDHEERVSLMNGLLPLVAREFPLGELNLLDIFSSPKNIYSEHQEEGKNYETPGH